ncbi:hypothetical protein V6N13_106719 [Hibiscus sabdariffa]
MHFGFIVSIKECIDCSLDLVTPLIDPINEKSLRKSKFQFIGGEWIRDPNTQEGDDAPPAPLVDASPALMAPPPNDALLACFEGKFATLDTRMTSIDSSIASPRTSFDTRISWRRGLVELRTPLPISIMSGGLSHMVMVEMVEMTMISPPFRFYFMHSVTF